MTPFRSGPPGQQIYGVYHAPAGASNGHAVLLCSPLGQEAVRIHRFYRVLAERLARSGTAVLRFDPYGCGESDGDDDDGHLERWVDDTLLAQRELLQRSRAKSVVWIGARLAAAIMAQASRRAEPRPHCLVFWDAVTDGKAYLDRLSHDHSRELQRALTHLEPPKPGSVRDEAIGFGLSERLRHQIAAITPATLAQANTQQLVLITPAHEKQDDLERLALAAGLDVLQEPLDLAFDWTSEEALNTALVPAQAMQAITRLIENAET
jgi:pimeloyl-ACP methyl ester carboxylesterase